jgi:hypothetical protein
MTVIKADFSQLAVLADRPIYLQRRRQQRVMTSDKAGEPDYAGQTPGEMPRRLRGV